MALIADLKYTSSWMVGAPYKIKDEASSFYFSIPSIYLSKPYKLEVGDKIAGKILSLKDINNEEYLELVELRGKEIEFVLYPLLADDHLFIAKKDWEENFREYGLVTNIYLSVRLEKAVRKDGVEIPLYTKRDVKI